MTDRTIAQRELRNNISAVLRAAEAGETFTVTVRGRPVARVVPPGTPGEPRIDVARKEQRAEKATDLLIVATAAVHDRTLHTRDERQASLARAAGIPVRLI